jgi:hypothetical protein
LPREWWLAPGIYRPGPESAREEEPTIPLALLAWLFSGAALLLPRSWRRAVTALPAFWLGLVGLRVALGVRHTSDLASALQGTDTRPHFLEISAAMLLVGLGALLHSAVRDFISSPPSIRWLTVLPLFKGALTVWLFRPLWWHARLAEALAEAGALVIGAWGLWSLARLVRARAGIERIDRWLTANSTAAGDREATNPETLMLAGALLALIPIASTLLAGTALAVVGLQGAARGRGLPGRSWLLLLFMLALVPAAWLLLTAAGSIAPSLATLSEAPFSSAAEAWIVPWLCIAAWGLSGLWPIQGVVPPPILAPLAGLLMVRIGVNALPEGMQGWQTVVAPLAVMSLWWAGITARPAMGLAAAGMFGAMAVPAGQGDGPMLLFGMAGVAAVLPFVPAQVSTPAWLPARLGWLVPAVAAWPVLEAGLRSQVAYSVLMAAGLSAAVAVSAAGRAADSR